MAAATPMGRLGSGGLACGLAFVVPVHVDGR